MCPTSPPANETTATLVYAMNGGTGTEAIFGTANLTQPRGDGSSTRYRWWHGIFKD